MTYIYILFSIPYIYIYFQIIYAPIRTISKCNSILPLTCSATFTEPLDIKNSSYRQATITHTAMRTLLSAEFNLQSFGLTHSEPDLLLVSKVRYQYHLLFMIMLPWFLHAKYCYFVIALILSSSRFDNCLCQIQSMRVSILLIEKLICTVSKVIISKLIISSCDCTYFIGNPETIYSFHFC